MSYVARDKKLRPDQKRWTVGINDSPSDQAIANRGKNPPQPVNPSVTTDYDEDSTNCYNCGFPIENKNARATCPLCQSDNFLGVKQLGVY